MATPKTINTRIKNRFDTLANWQGAGVELLPGEIALVSVTTQQINKATGDVVDVPALLMKVGESDGNGGTKSFDSLPWLSALASDVYDWAKESDPSTITVKYNKGSSASPNWSSSTLADLLKDLETLEAQVANKSDSNHIHSSYVNQNAFSNIKAGNVTVAADTTTDTVEFAAEKNITITGTNGTGTTVDKVTFSVADATNQVAGVVKLSDATDDTSATTNGKTAATPKAVAEAMAKAKDAAQAASNALQAANHDHPYLPLGTKYAGSDTVGGAAIKAKQLVNALTLQLNGGTTDGTDRFIFDGSDVATVDITPAKLGIDMSAINSSISTNAQDIKDIKDSLTGGVHFKGVLMPATPVSDGDDVGTTPYILNDSSGSSPRPYTPEKGDVVIFGDKEFICTGTKWVELGDLSRVGTIETSLATLPNKPDAADHEFVAYIEKNAEGKFVAVRRQPETSDIKHGVIDLASKLSAIDGAISGKADAHEHPYLPDTTKYAGSSSKGGPATSAVKVQDKITFKADGTGDAADTEFDGSAAKTISYNTIGAAASGHTHSGYESRLSDIESDIESNLVRYDDSNKRLMVGNNPDDPIAIVIFDCGNASGWED